MCLFVFVTDGRTEYGQTSHDDGITSHGKIGRRPILDFQTYSFGQLFDVRQTAPFVGQNDHKARH